MFDKKILQKFTLPLFIEFGGFSSKIYCPKHNIRINKLSLFDKENESFSVFQNGIILDFDIAKKFVQNVFEELNTIIPFHKRLFGYTLYVSIHECISEVAVTALRDILEQQNANSIVFLPEGISVLHAYSNGTLGKAESYLLCHAGESVSEIVLSINEKIKYRKSLLFGSDDLAKALQQNLESLYTLNISINDINDLLTTFKFSGKRDSKKITLFGQNQINKTPVKFEVESVDIMANIQKSLRKIENEINLAIKEIPINHMKKIYENGLYVSGGFWKMNGLSDLLEKDLNIKVKVDTGYPYSVVEGMANIFEQKKIDKYQIDEDFFL